MVAIIAALLVVLREFLAGAMSLAKTINILGFGALASGTLLILEAIRARRRVDALLGAQDAPSPRPTAKPTDGPR